jgi:hypothetical protein
MYRFTFLIARCFNLSIDYNVVIRLTSSGSSRVRKIQSLISQLQWPSGSIAALSTQVIYVDSIRPAVNCKTPWTLARHSLGFFSKLRMYIYPLIRWPSYAEIRAFQHGETDSNCLLYSNSFLGNHALWNNPIVKQLIQSLVIWPHDWQRDAESYTQNSLSLKCPCLIFIGHSWKTANKHYARVRLHVGQHCLDRKHRLRMSTRLVGPCSLPRIKTSGFSCTGQWGDMSNLTVILNNSISAVLGEAMSLQPTLSNSTHGVKTPENSASIIIRSVFDGMVDTNVRTV